MRRSISARAGKALPRPPGWFRSVRGELSAADDVPRPGQAPSFRPTPRAGDRLCLTRARVRGPIVHAAGRRRSGHHLGAAACARGKEAGLKSDEQLQGEVREELLWDPLVGDAAVEVEVAVRQGVATLTGRVRREAERALAERAARRVAGVRGVVNALRAGDGDGHAPTDAELAEDAVRALDWDLWVPSGRVRVQVRDGWITLEGEVDSWYQKDAAVRDLARVAGVGGVTDALTIRATPAPAEVGERIGRALERTADAAAAIRVETFPGAVLLRGVVSSAVERARAERAAWSTPGVVEVCNGLEVCDASPDPHTATQPGPHTAWGDRPTSRRAAHV